MPQYLLYLFNLYSQGIFSIQSLDEIIFIHLEFNPNHISIENEEILDSLMNKIERLSTNKADLLKYSDTYFSEQDIQRDIQEISGINSFHNLIEENLRYEKLKTSLIDGSLFPYDFLIIIKRDFGLEEFTLLFQQLRNDFSNKENPIDWEFVRKQIIFILNGIKL